MNRGVFTDRVSQAIGHAARERERLAVLVLEVEHSRGGSLRASLRASDTVAWLGGERFGGLLPKVNCPPDALLYVLRRMVAAAAPAPARIGIALFPEDGGDCATLLRNADGAMGRAARHGSERFRFDDERVDRAARERSELEAQLRRALQKREFELYYQPKQSLADGRIDGAEALLRWRAADGKPVPPERFIPLAEATGLIEPISEWVVDTACRQLKRWAQAGLMSAPIAVNVSPRQFRTGRFLQQMQSTLEREDISPRMLEIEITESSLAENESMFRNALQRMKALGLSLSMDDFGAGYSRLGYLKSIPLEEIKIDRSFITEVGSDPKTRAIVEAIIWLGHKLGMKLVAEGVETQAQRDCLRAMGCDDIQGYYCSKPLPPLQFEELLRKSRIGA